MDFLKKSISSYFCAMSNIKNCYLIDEGNTSIKIAKMENGSFGSLIRIGKEELNNFDFEELPIACSSVISKGLTSMSERKLNIFEINTSCKLGFSSKYQSMVTLGIDRMCNVQAMSVLRENENRLCIDIGTCIKFDFLNAQDEYLGGSISPGINLRYRSLNDYTDRLPLLNSKVSTDLIGNSTQESIISGVMNGIQNELLGMVHEYEREYGQVSIFLTGGDSKYFDLTQKNNIFADENLTLRGIHSVFNLNAI